MSSVSAFEAARRVKLM